MARVFVGVHRKTGRVAAVKIRRDGPLAAQRFRREVEAMQSLDHTHVMPILEWISRAVVRDAAGALLAQGVSPQVMARPYGSYSALRPPEWCALAQPSERLRPPGYFARQCPQAVQRTLGPLRCGLVFRVERPDLRLSTARGSGQSFSGPTEVLMDPSSATPTSDAWSIGALASWFTALTRRQTPTSAGGRYWSQLIDGTMRMEPSARWKVTPIAAHLVEELPAIRILGVGDPRRRAMRPLWFNRRARPRRTLHRVRVLQSVLSPWKTAAGSAHTVWSCPTGLRSPAANPHQPHDLVLKLRPQRLQGGPESFADPGSRT